MNFLLPLISWQFWFDLTPTRMAAGFEAAFFGLFALLIVAGSVMRMVVRNAQWEKYRAEVAARIASVASYAGIVGLVWFFLTFEEIQFFGSRFWFLAWIVGVIIAIVRIIRFTKRDVPVLKHREQSRAEVNKYLPRRGR